MAFLETKEDMTDVEREESETGKFSMWVYIKNWISDYLKSTDIDIDDNKYVSTNVKNQPVVLAKGSTDGGFEWVPLKVTADGKVILVSG